MLAWLRKLILRWRRNRYAYRIRKDRAYLRTVAQDMGFQRSWRLTWQIQLLFDRPPKS